MEEKTKDKIVTACCKHPSQLASTLIDYTTTLKRNSTSVKQYFLFEQVKHELANANYSSKKEAPSNSPQD